MGKGTYDQTLHLLSSWGQGLSLYFTFMQRLVQENFAGQSFQAEQQHE